MKWETFDFDSYLSKTFCFFENKQNIQFQVQKGRNVPLRVTSDKGRLEQITVFLVKLLLRLLPDLIRVSLKVSLPENKLLERNFLQFKMAYTAFDKTWVQTEEETTNTTKLQLQNFSHINTEPKELNH